VGSFVLFSIANYEYCQYKRQLEKAGMKRAVEIIAQKKSEKEEAARIKREERRRAKEEADRREEEERRKKSWRFW
jgi:cytochrome c oxidase assembly protein subunit 20